MDPNYSTLIAQKKCCWWNAAHNRIVYKRTRNLNLRWVVGAWKVVLNRKMGWGSSNGYNPITKLPRTGEADIMRNWDDTHAWLEDEDGNVYDYFYQEDIDLMPEQRPDFTLEAGRIEGVSRADLAKKGYIITPYAIEDQGLVAVCLNMNVQSPKRRGDILAATRDLTDTMTFEGGSFDAFLAEARGVLYEGLPVSIPMPKPAPKVVSSTEDDCEVPSIVVRSGGKKRGRK